MTATDILHEAEADLAALATLPGEIRAKVKAGVADLGSLRDAIDAALAGLTGSARATLHTLETLAEADRQTATPRPDDAPVAATVPDPVPAASAPLGG